jgi:hypothetical protein
MKNAFSALLLFSAIACSSITAPTVRLDATIHYNPIEGGFYEIVGDDGVHYDPINLADCYKSEGLPVQVTLRVRKDVMSIHAAGPIVDVESIYAPGLVCAVNTS